MTRPNNPAPGKMPRIKIPKPENINPIDEFVNLIQRRGIMWQHIAGFMERNDIDVNSPNSDHLFPLVSAVQAENVDVVHFLIHSGANVNVISFNGDTPLIRLCKKNVFTENDNRIARILILAGANPDLQDNEGITARSLKPELIEEATQMHSMTPVAALQENKKGNPFFIDPLLISDIHEYAYGSKKAGNKRKTNKRKTNKRKTNKRKTNKQRRRNLK